MIGILEIAQSYDTGKIEKLAASNIHDLAH
jgi:hypothetical protein